MSDFTRNESGLLVPSSDIKVGGVFDIFVNGELVEQCKNLVVNEGLNYLLDVGLSGGSAETNWYVTALTGDVTPVATWTGANFDTNATEIVATTGVAEATRQAWAEAGASAQAIDNYASKAELTVAAANLTLDGVAVLSGSGFANGSDKLMAASRFSAARALVQDDVLGIGYRIAMSSS